jgi:putative membrane protein
MLRMIINWLLSAVALIIVTYVVPGFYLHGFLAALWAAVVIGFVNATLGSFLKLITLPLTVLTLGIFWIVINAIMLEVASFFSPNFRISSFGAAFIGAIVLALVQMLLRWLLLPERNRQRY